MATSPLIELLDLNHRESRTTMRRLHFQGKARAFMDLLETWAPSPERAIQVFRLSDPSTAYAPYAPFLDALGRHFRSLPHAESLWEKLAMLPFQEDTLKSWITGRPRHRTDLPPAGETRYEREMLNEAILSAFELLSSERPIDLAVADAQGISMEAAELLSSLSERGRMRGLVLLHFDWDLLPPERMDLSWLEGFRTEIWVNHGFLDLGPPQAPYPETVPPAEPGILLEAMASCCDFFTAHQGLDAIHRLAELHPQEPGILAGMHFHRAWFLHHLERAKTMEASFTNEEAIQHYQLSLDAEPEGPWAAEANASLAEIAIDSFDYARARDFARKAIDIARKGGQTVRQARASILYHIATLRYGLNDSWEGWKEAIAFLESQGPSPSLINGLLSVAPINRFLEFQDTVSECIDRGLELARSMGHRSFLSGALHLKGVMVSLKRGEREALPNFEQGLELRTALGEVIPLIGIQNGLSYSFLNQGDLATSFEYLKRSIAILYKVRDFHEISMTLFNLAMLYFHGRRFDLALPVLQRVLQIMHTLSMTTLPFNTIANVELFRAYCSLKEGDGALVAGLAERIERNRDSLTPLALPYYALFRELLSEGKGRLPSGEEPAVPWEELEQDHSVRMRIRPFYDLERGLLLMRTGRGEEGKALLSAGLAFSREAGSALFPAWFEKCLRTGSEPAPFPFPDLGIDLEPLVTLARQELNLRAFNRKMRDIQFINRTMDALSRCSDEDELNASFLRLVANHCPGISGSILSLGEGGPVLLSHPQEAPVLIQSEFLAVMQSGIQGLVYPRRLESGLKALAAWESAIVFPLTEGDKLTGGVVFGASPERGFRESDRDLFGILLGNYALKRLSIRQNRELENMARLDALSHLGNRKGLHHRLSMEQNRLSRRDPSRTEPRFAVCFIDLDNFKYYNDSFGHQAGDYLISQMGTLIKSVFRETDFPSRYGGDEFVVLLPDTNAAEASTPSSRLLSELRVRAGYQAELSGLLGKKVSIPEDMHLSCSIGIADLANLPEGHKLDLELLINIADHALYHAKEEGKGRIVRA